MKMDESEVVATSTDLCEPGQRILIANDDKHIVINSKKRVSIYSLINEKYVKDVLENEVVETIWIQEPDQDHFYALCSTLNSLSLSKVEIPSGKILKKLKINPNLSIPDSTIAIKAEFEQEEVALKKVFYLCKGRKSGTHLSAQENSTGKKFSFGLIDQFDFNSELVVTTKNAIEGQKGQKLQVFSTTLGNTLWDQKISETRPLTQLKCAPGKLNFFATGDKSGRVRVWKSDKTFTENHWHSLPISSLQFTLDGVHLFTGGGEGVIVKWEAKSMTKLCLVPRLGSNICEISLSFGKVLAATQNNTLKVFTSNLEDDGLITGLTSWKQNKVKWDPETNCLVLIGPSKHYLQFFSPLERKQKKQIEMINQNVILGEREAKIPYNELEDFDIKANWCSTLEKTWDGQNLLKFWKIKEKVELCSRFGVDEKIHKIKFIQDWAMISFQDKCAKLWTMDNDKWGLTETFQHLGLKPTSVTSSKDSTVLAIGFETLVLVYDLNSLAILAILGAKNHVQDSYQSLEIRSRYLIGATKTGLFVWDLINLEIIGKFDAMDVEIIENPNDEENMYIKTQSGIYVLNNLENSQKLFNGVTKSMTAPALSHHERIYFIEKTKGTNCLKFIKTKPEVTNADDDKMEVDQDENIQGLQIKLDELKVTVKENIFHARKQPPVDPDFVTRKVSLSSELIIKRALPI